jgi:chromate transporter
VEGAGEEVNLLLLYFLLCKVVFTSFSGMGSLPMLRQELVVERHVLTDRQLNTAIVAGRTGPGPNGLYVVSVGYFVGGLPGAALGLIALITPAFLVIPMMRWIGRHAQQTNVRGAIRAIVLASAGLLAAAAIPLSRDAASGPLMAVLLAVSFLVLTFTGIESWWVMIAAAVVGLAGKLFV